MNRINHFGKKKKERKESKIICEDERPVIIIISIENIIKNTSK